MQKKIKVQLGEYFVGSGLVLKISVIGLALLVIEQKLIERIQMQSLSK